MQPDSRIRPNLVYLFADQLRYHACGFAGDPWAQTSNIDSLAKQGVDFTNATSCTPVCAAHRASLFTGKYQSSHGMVINSIALPVLLSTYKNVNLMKYPCILKYKS